MHNSPFIGFPFFLSRNRALMSELICHTLNCTENYSVIYKYWASLSIHDTVLKKEMLLFVVKLHKIEWCHGAIIIITICPLHTMLSDKTSPTVQLNRSKLNKGEELEPKQTVEFVSPSCFDCGVSDSDPMNFLWKLWKVCLRTSQPEASFPIRAVHFVGAPR